MTTARSEYPLERTGWRARALCAGEPAEMFAPTTIPDLVVAQAFCRHCPVRIECEEAATPHDRYHTVRGGLKPGLFRERDIASIRRHQAPDNQPSLFMEATA